MTKGGNVLEVALRALGRSAMRSLRTGLGTVVGVACLVAAVG